MSVIKYTIITTCLFFITLPAVSVSLAENTSLPSWNEGMAKKAIISFVQSVTDQNKPAFVQPSKRIAVFDNDGTLWSEKPFYFQLLFVMDRVRVLAGQNPEWKNRHPFKAVLEQDKQSLAMLSEKDILELLIATHAGMTAGEFTDIVTDWIETATHPDLHEPYTKLVYQPMLELLEYLHANKFIIFIVSGGGIEFMRPWVERVYGIPPERVVGSSIVTRFEMRGGKPVLVREPRINFIDDKAGKPVGINQHIGRRPIFAFGNSDGDLQMLQWTTLAGEGKRFAGIVHHTDNIREFAYDRNSHVGRLDKGLDAAEENGWTVVDMKKDWKVIYPFKK